MLFQKNSRFGVGIPLFTLCYTGVHAPGRLPDFSDVDMQSIVSWGRRADGTIITVNSATIITPLVFTTTVGMGEECKRYHNRLAELVTAKKGEDYATTVSWIRSKVSFAILRLALLCLRGSRTVKRTIRSNVHEADFELDRCLAKI